MIKFRQKEFSNIIPYAAKGAGLGLSVSGGISIFRKKPKDQDAREFNNGIILKSTLVGAGLGAAVGLVKDVAEKINRKTTVDRRFMEDVCSILWKDGFKPNEHFTLDKKVANQLKTKVCLVVSKESGCLELRINTIADNKLKNVVDNITKNLPNMSVTNSKYSDKFNEITITSLKECDKTTVGLIVNAIEGFLHAGYPVFMVEVG